MISFFIFIFRVINHEGETIELYSSADCKGIVGNDGRLYILDLLRTFPVDINYSKEQQVEISDELQKAGYPLNSRHSFVTFRQELVDAFVELVLNSTSSALTDTTI